MSNDLMTLLS